MNSTGVSSSETSYVPRHPEWVYRRFCGVFKLKINSRSVVFHVYPSNLSYYDKTVTRCIFLDSYILTAATEILEKAERIEPMPEQFLPKFKTQKEPEEVESYNIKYPLLAKYLG